MNNELPKNVWLGFTMNVYKDMEFADEIEYSNSYDGIFYENAKKDFQTEVQKSNGSYFVELIARTEIEYEDGRFETEETQIAHNQE